MKAILLLFPLPVLIYMGFVARDHLKENISVAKCNEIIDSQKEKVNRELEIIGYEKGCKEAGSHSCSFVQDEHNRYEDCIRSSEMNCKTWTSQYKDNIHEENK